MSEYYSSAQGLMHCEFKNQKDLIQALYFAGVIKSPAELAMDMIANLVPPERADRFQRVIEVPAEYAHGHDAEANCRRRIG
jgi:hypothetical protein